MAKIGGRTAWCYGLVGLLYALPAFGQTETKEPPLTPAPATAVPATPRGIEVLARGPVHEAFATPTTEPAPTKPVPKKPPKALEEMPPDQKPEGEVVWINGYWAWDDEKKDFLWVSGIWRTLPPAKQWVAGYWRDANDQWQWVPGFWTGASQEATKQEVTYLPQPPAIPDTASPGEAPAADTFYVPGNWYWGGTHYAWRAGYWARVQPGYVWVPAHYRWTPGGCVFISGYWDLAIPRRGLLYAPVYVDVNLVGPTFVYTPAYVVRDTMVLDSLFVRPCFCHYYFGDYYGPMYRDWGYESFAVYGRRHYDSIYVYSAWEHRYEPGWSTVQLDITLARHAGRAPLPPRTLVQQNTIVQNNITNVTNVTNVNNTTIKNTTINNSQMLVPASNVTAATGVATVPVNNAARMQAKQQAQATQQVAVQRTQSEMPSASGALSQPRVASLNLPPAPSSSGQPLAKKAGALPGNTGTISTGGKPASGPSTLSPSFTGGRYASPASRFPMNPSRLPPPRPKAPPPKQQQQQQPSKSNGPGNLP